MADKQSVFIRLFLGLALIVLALIVISHQEFSKKPKVSPSNEDLGPPGFAYEIRNFTHLSGWEEDQVATAWPVFLRSCEKIKNAPPTDQYNPVEALNGPQAEYSFQFSGLNSDWQHVCNLAAAISENISDQTVRTFFEQYFLPVQIFNIYTDENTSFQKRTTKKQKGVFTGYFEPVYNASSVKGLTKIAPLYARPDDLIELDLGQFRRELAGQRLAGYVEEGRLKPYPSRRKINQGSLGHRASILAWLEPDDAFFLQIQGSGVLKMEDGSFVRVGYAGQNGHPYTAIGKPLIERGEIAREDMSLQAIRNWLQQAPPEQARTLREENASFVFFQVLKNLKNPDLGPLGANGVQLTPKRSLAADRRYHAMGTPAWIEIENLSAGGENKPLHQLMIIQDTGGAIKGPVRGDVFWGRGEDAKQIAGQMNASGQMIVLLPKLTIGRWQNSVEKLGLEE